MFVSHQASDQRDGLYDSDKSACVGSNPSDLHRLCWVAAPAETLTWDSGSAGRQLYVIWRRFTLFLDVINLYTSSVFVLHGGVSCEMINNLVNFSPLAVNEAECQRTKFFLKVSCKVWCRWCWHGVSWVFLHINHLPCRVSHMLFQSQQNRRPLGAFRGPRWSTAACCTPESNTWESESFILKASAESEYSRTSCSWWSLNIKYEYYINIKLQVWSEYQSHRKSFTQEIFSYLQKMYVIQWRCFKVSYMTECEEEKQDIISISTWLTLSSFRSVASLRFRTEHQSFLLVQLWVSESSCESFI